jgi:glycosyltransferase involved in cell wall biosynthesis
MSMDTKLQKNILFIQPKLEGVGGIEKVVPDVAKEMTSRGYRVSTLIFYGNIPTTQTFWHTTRVLIEDETRNIIHRIYKLITRIFIVGKYVRNIQPNTIVVPAQGATIIILLAKSLRLFRRVRVVVYVHEVFTTSGRLYSILMKFLYPSADAFIFVSSGLQKDFSTHIDIAHLPQTVAYNSVSLPKELPICDFDFSNYQRPFFANASRLEKIKGTDILVDTFLNYAQSHPGTLFIMGTGLLRGELEKKIADYNMSDRIIFLGYSDNVPGFVKACDVYLSCSRFEGFPISLLETVNLQIPFVFTDCNYGPRELLNISLDKKIQYPYLTNIGSLFSDIDTYEKDVVMFYKYFEQAIQKTLELNKYTLQEASLPITKIFSLEHQVDNIETIV